MMLTSKARLRVILSSDLMPVGWVRHFQAEGWRDGVVPVHSDCDVPRISVQFCQGIHSGPNPVGRACIPLNALALWWLAICDPPIQAESI